MSREFSILRDIKFAWMMAIVIAITMFMAGREYEKSRIDGVIEGDTHLAPMVAGDKVSPTAKPAIVQSANESSNCNIVSDGGRR